MRRLFTTLFVTAALALTAGEARAQFGCPNTGGALTLQSGGTTIFSPGADTLIAPAPPGSVCLYVFGLSVLPVPFAMPQAAFGTCEDPCTLICSPPFLQVLAPESFPFTIRAGVNNVNVCVQASWIDGNLGNCLNVTNALVVNVVTAP